MSQQGDLQGAQRLEERTVDSMKRTLGKEHPETLRVMGNLAITLEAREDLIGAQSMLKQVAEARRRVLGDDHPDTLEATRKLTNLTGHSSDSA